MDTPARARSPGTVNMPSASASPSALTSVSRNNQSQNGIQAPSGSAARPPKRIKKEEADISVAYRENSVLLLQFEREKLEFEKSLRERELKVAERRLIIEENEFQRGERRMLLEERQLAQRRQKDWTDQFVSLKAGGLSTEDIFNILGPRPGPINDL